MIGVMEESANYKKMKPYFRMMRDIMSGTKTMRLARTRYLPQHPAEDDDDYNIRLNMAVLTPFTENLVNYYSSKVFARPLEFQVSGKSAPKELEEYLEDIDMTGRHMRVFARDLFEEGFTMGIGYIYIDTPREIGGTEEERKKNRARAYFVQIPPENVIDVRTDESGEITMARIVEYFNSYGSGDTEFKEELKKRVRVVEQNRIRIFENDAKGNPVLVDEFVNSAGFVPLVPFYANRKKQFEAKPPLAEIAEQNISHYQFRSNHQNALQFAQFPMLASSGVKLSEKQKVEVGPKKWLRADDPDAKFYIVEHEGKALESGRKYINDISEEMVSHGIQLLQTNSQNRSVTATEQRIRESTSVSAVQTVAFNLADALENALVMLETLGGVKGASEVQVVVNGSFTMTMTDVQEIAALTDLNITRRLTLRTLYIELKRRGVLGDTFDIDKEIDLLENEGPDFLSTGKWEQEGGVSNITDSTHRDTEIDITLKDEERKGGMNITNQMRRAKREAMS